MHLLPLFFEIRRPALRVPPRDGRQQQYVGQCYVPPGGVQAPDNRAGKVCTERHNVVLQADECAQAGGQSMLSLTESKACGCFISCDTRNSR